MKTVVTIPAFNEQDTIGTAVGAVKEAVPRATVLVVDDGSRDQTAQRAKEAGAKVVVHPINYGLAATFRSEMKTAIALSADVVVHIDADLQYRASEIPLLLKPIQDKRADLVLGSRFRGRIQHMPLLKRWGNRAFSAVISKVIGVPISDAQTGFRAFSREVAELETTSDHTYTQEQIIHAVRAKYRIAEVPIHFDRRQDKSRLIANPFEYAAKAWINLLRIYRDYNPLKFFGIVGGSMMAIGLAMGVWIVWNIVSTGAVGGIPRVILSALFIMTGLQVLLFGFLADMRR